MVNPYAGLPDHQFWRRSVSRVEKHRLDPVVRPRFTIGRHERVVTAGSCFAQHISRKLAGMGFNYHVAEAGDGLTAEEAKRRNFGVFSARYGNIYTARQLLQLFREAFGEWAPVNVAEQRADGRWVDIYRPLIEPDGFSSAAEVAMQRREHLAKVRALFRDADVLVFTLGLTEAWRCRADGSVFPLAPGTVAGSMTAERHEFVNFEVEDVVDDLNAVLTKLTAVNPTVRTLLTVSPVPLIATYEPRHVLTSTTYSKAVLRVAADKIVRAYSSVDYFPSFEIITGAYAGGSYYEDDYREVSGLGVAHAMRCFTANYATNGEVRPTTALAGSAPAGAGRGEIICDEEMMDVVKI